MPSKSKDQAAFMKAAAHNRNIAKKNNISQATAREFEAADEKKATVDHAGRRTRMYKKGSAWDRKPKSEGKE